MISSKYLLITYFVCLLVSAQAAPATDTPAGQEAQPTTTIASAPTTTTTTSSPISVSEAADTSSSSTAAPATIAPASPSTTTAPASDAAVPSTTPVPSSTNTMPPAGNSSALAHEHLSKTSSFTCYGRSIGYYADIERECKVYHFCLLGEYNGDPVYQRITYLCLKDTVFDQQALDCVEPSKLTSQCKDAQTFYESSNTSLKQEIQKIGGK